MHIGSTHNRTARPFPGFGGGASSTSSSSASYSAPSQQPSYQGQQAPYQGQQASYQGQQPSYQQDQTVPAVVNAQYNTPINMYSTQNTMDTYNQQAQALTGDMQGLVSVFVHSYFQRYIGNSEKRRVGMLRVSQKNYSAVPP